jgi:CubicO group peptidase (beta-lactamase class C family)
MIERAAATPYDDLGRPVPGPRFTALAAAGLQTTLEDFARFAQASMPGKATPALRLLRPETIASMQSPQPASPDYGLGYGLSRVSPTLTGWGHGGANLGWMAVFEVIPATGDGIIVLTNGSNGGVVHRMLTCAWHRWLTEDAAPCRRPIGLSLLRTILADGVGAGIRRYHELKRTAAKRYGFEEFQLNGLGYALLRAGRVEDALAIFALNVEMFPQGYNTYDSLGEAYMVHGDSALAIANYEKSLELNPDNANAVEMLRRLRR